MRELAQEWLAKEMRKARIAFGRAEDRPGVTPDELRNLQNKVDIIDWLLCQFGMLASRWISVKDGLPEKGTYVAVYYGKFIGNLVDIMAWDGEAWYKSGFREDAEWITHWMPLPEAPKEDSK